MQTRAKPLGVAASVLAVALSSIIAQSVTASGASNTTTPIASYSTRTEDGSVLLHDRFSPAKRSVWQFYNRQGRIAQGRLWIDGDYSAGSLGRDGWALTHIGDSTWRDYTFEVTYSNDNVGGSPDVHMSNLYARVASETGNTRGSMYRFNVFAAGEMDPTGNGACGGGIMLKGMVELTKYLDGVQSYLKTVCASNTFVGKNTATVQVVGDKIVLSTNGQEVLSYRDADRPILSGGVGVGQIWETNGWFDNVVVRSVP